MANYLDKYLDNPTILDEPTDSDSDEEELDEEELDEVELDEEELDEEELDESELEPENLNGVDFLNIFLIYYKQLFTKPTNINMFNDIDYNKGASTNRSMEFIYDHVCKYKEGISDKELHFTNNINIETCKELYQLNTPNYLPVYCQYLVPLITHLTTLDWVNLKWEIIPLKTDN